MADPFKVRAARWLAAPPGWFKRLLSGKPLIVDGRLVDADLQYYCKLRGTRDHTGDPGNLEQARGWMDLSGSLGVDRPAGALTEDVRVPVVEGVTIRARIYRAEGAARPAPAVVYFHGGGWTYGSVESHDNLCRRICLQGRCTVVSVEYRCAPEHPFPTPLDDSHAAYLWVVDNAESLGIVRSKVAVGGDSAGGNLSTVICARCIDRGQPAPCFQWLLYPATDLSSETESFRRFGMGLYLQQSDMAYFKRCYLGDGAQASNPEASPLLRADLGRMPPAYVLTAGFDVLRDEGRAYAERLRQAGVTVTEARHDSLIHGFVTMTVIGPGPRRATDEAIAVLSAALHG